MKPSVLGVVIVTFNSTEVIHGCLESLMAATDVNLRVVIVDNSSADDTVECIRFWMKRTKNFTLPSDLPFPLEKNSKSVPFFETDGSDAPPDKEAITLLHAGVNGGFAAGVNRGMAYLAQDLEITRFWILNPDCVVPPNTPKALAEHPEPDGGFALMGGRINYLFPPDKIQSDGGMIRPLTGVTVNLNRGRAEGSVVRQVQEKIDFICGASMVASRKFYELAGPMSEDYFLYYEEVDWALRRGNFPLLWCDTAPVYHHVGSSIGSGYLSRESTPFAIYFIYRSRLIFVRKHFPRRILLTYIWGLGKMIQLIIGKNIEQAYALICAIHGLPPPNSVRSRLSTETQKIIFGRS